MTPSSRTLLQAPNLSRAGISGDSGVHGAHGAHGCHQSACVCNSSKASYLYAFIRLYGARHGIYTLVRLDTTRRQVLQRSFNLFAYMVLNTTQYHLSRHGGGGSTQDNRAIPGPDLRRHAQKEGSMRQNKVDCVRGPPAACGYAQVSLYAYIQCTHIVGAYSLVGPATKPLVQVSTF